MTGQKAMVDSLDERVNAPHYVKFIQTPFRLRSISRVIGKPSWTLILLPRRTKTLLVLRRLGAYVFHRIFPKVDVVVTDKTEGFRAALTKAAMKSEQCWSRTGGAKKARNVYTAVTTLSKEIYAY